jgi:hypothetical protein
LLSCAVIYPIILQLSVKVWIAHASIRQQLQELSATGGEGTRGVTEDQQRHKSELEETAKTEVTAIHATNPPTC